MVDSSTTLSSVAYPLNHYLLAFGGPIRSGPEQWSCSLRMRMTGSWDPAVGAPDGKAGEEAALASIVTRLKTWSTNQNTVIAADAKLEWVKFNLIGTNGRYVRGYTNLHEESPAVAFGVGTCPFPNQVTLVATLRTAIGRGLASKGRIFLPCPKIAVDNDGRISTTNQTAATNAVKALLDSLNTVESGLKVAIVSGTREGQVSDVTTVEVGRVYDTMRSRRTSLEEVPAPVALAATGG